MRHDNTNCFRTWECSELPQISQPPAVILEEACNGRPVRTPSGHGTNVVSYIPSSKMDTMMLAESRSLEQKACYLQELYPPIKAYYSQPYRFNLMRHDRRGVLKSTVYTPDFLSVTQDTTGCLHYILVECKKVESMLKKPHRYLQSKGQWTDPEASSELNKIGFHLAIFCDDDVTPVLKKNLSLLMPQTHIASKAKNKRHD